MRDWLSTVTSSANTSTSPEATAGFSLPAGRRLTAPFHLNDPLWAQLLGRPVRRCRQFGIEYYLDDSGAVAQVDENNAAVVAPAADPSGQSAAAVDVLGPEGAAISGP